MKVQRQNEWCVGVVIPACNEESTIEKCLATIFSSLAHARVRDAWVIVVADGCTDATVGKARRSVGSLGEVLEIDVQSAGAARRAGAARVLDHFRGVNPAQIWLANTDADTHVMDDWIAVQLTLADAGIAGVAGIVRLDAAGSTAAHEIFQSSYEINSDGTHSHVHGANLSLRGDAYSDVGGWSDLSLAEDHCLWNRLRQRGWRLFSPINSIVITSARLHGRAVGGFADTLRNKIQSRHADA